MSSATRAAVAALGVCALLDVMAAPALLSAFDSDTAMTVLAVGVLALGVLTVLAAVGIARGQSWGVPLALVTRAIDVLGALPGLAEGPGPALGVAAVMVASAVAAVLVLRLRRMPIVS